MVLWPVCPEGHDVLIQGGSWAWCRECYHLEERLERGTQTCGRPISCRVHEAGEQDEYCEGHGLHFMAQFSEASLVSLVD